MNPPDFWRTGGWPAAALAPLGWLYAAGGAARLQWGASFDPGVPTICVGNLTLGGAGKTPTVLAVAARTVVARRLISPVDLEGLAADLDVDLDVVLSTLEQLRAAWLIWWTPGGGVVSVRP